MRAVVLHEVGGDLRVEEVPEPDGDAVVEVRAAGINFADLLIRHGLYPQMPELPFVLGTEVAGELDGRRVLAFTRVNGGGYAERVAVDPALDVRAAGRRVVRGRRRVPAHLSHRLHPAASADARDACEHRARACRLGRRRLRGDPAREEPRRARDRDGEHADEKRAFARDNGADEAIGYDELDDVRVDVVIDPVGGDVFTRSLPLLNPLGVDRRGRLRRRAVAGPERAVARRPERRRASASTSDG